MFRLFLVMTIVGSSLAQFANINHHNQFNRFHPFNRFNHQPRYFTSPAPLHINVNPTEAPKVPNSADALRYNKYASSNPYDVDAVILKSTNDVHPDGHFQYSYETSNGIAAQAVGTPKNFGGNPPNTPVAIEGSFSWVAPDGTPVNIGYVADEYGYRAAGDAIPTPPPIPEAILRSLRAQGINLQNKKK